MIERHFTYTYIRILMRSRCIIRAEAEIVHQLCGTVCTCTCFWRIRYTSHPDVMCLSGIFTGCVWKHSQIPANHWQCEWTKIKQSQDKCRVTLSLYFWESLCERGSRFLNPLKGLRRKSFLLTLLSSQRKAQSFLPRLLGCGVSA